MRLKLIPCLFIDSLASIRIYHLRFLTFLLSWSRCLIRGSRRSLASWSCTLYLFWSPRKFRYPRACPCWNFLLMHYTVVFLIIIETHLPQEVIIKNCFDWFCFGITWDKICHFLLVIRFDFLIKIINYSMCSLSFSVFFFYILGKRIKRRALVNRVFKNRNLIVSILHLDKISIIVISDKISLIIKLIFVNLQLLMFLNDSIFLTRKTLIYKWA